MEHTLTIQKIVDAHNKEHYDFIERNKSEKSKKIAEAIRVATGGTYIGPMASQTLLGWFPKYDDQGRPLNADPNTITSTVCIDGKNYRVEKWGWDVAIFEGDIQLCAIDLTPDYIEKRETPEWKEWYVDGDTIVNPNNGRTGHLVDNVVVWHSPKRDDTPSVVYMPYILSENVPLIEV